MRQTLLFFLFTQILAAAAAAQNCPQYTPLMQNARIFWDKGDFDKALKQLTAAREHCPEKGKDVDAQFVAFTREIADKYKEAETQKSNAQRATKQALRDAAAARSAMEQAQRQALSAYANDLAYKSQIALRNGDRTVAFRLAEFAHRYVDDDNLNVTHALTKALYYNETPDTTHRLAFRETLTGHTSYVWSVAFSPDGKRLATGSSDNTAKIWDFTPEGWWASHNGRNHRLAGLTAEQLTAFSLEKLLDQHPGNEQKLIATRDVWQIKAFADLAASKAGGSNILSKVAPIYARAERLYSAALDLQNELLIRMDYAKMLRRWAAVY